MTIQPPIDNDHVAPGCEPFDEETIKRNASGDRSPITVALLREFTAALAHPNPGAHDDYNKGINYAVERVLDAIDAWRARMPDGWDRWYTTLPDDLKRRLSIHDFKRLGDVFKEAFGP